MRTILATLLVLTLSACGDPVGLCVYEDDPDLDDSCWPESFRSTCDGIFYRDVSCDEVGYPHDCGDLGVFYTADQETCESE